MNWEDKVGEDDSDRCAECDGDLYGNDPDLSCICGSFEEVEARRGRCVLDEDEDEEDIDEDLNDEIEDIDIDEDGEDDFDDEW